MARGRRVPKKIHTQDDKAAELDALAEFEQFREQFLPAIRKDLSSGIDADEIMRKYKNLAAAKLVMKIVDAQSDMAQIAAAEKLLDRIDGKPVQKQELKHRLEQLSDEELEAAVKSKMLEVGFEEETEGDKDDLQQ